MNFKLIGENDYHNAVETIFKNRGVHDLERLLNVNERNTHHWSNLVNIQEAVDCLLSHLKQGNKVFVKVDSDCDGYCSSAILINRILKSFPDADITWQLQKGKEHGVEVEDVPKEMQLVIIPDAGSNQYEVHKALKDKGIDVIVLDHHEAESLSEHAIVVNNQLSPNYPNKNFSGAGIVYKFCEALDDALGEDYADEFLDLVAVGNIGDMMDLRELETRYYAKEGLKRINNPLLKAIIEKQDYSMGGVVNIHTTAFYVVPLINAAVRSATNEEKVAMMKSFLEYDEEVYYVRGKVYEDLHTSVARSLGNIRNRQNAPKDKSIPIIEQYLLDNGMLEDKAIVLDISEMLDKNLTGLVANQIARKYRRPVLFLRKQSDGLYGGSGRGFESGEVKDFREFLLKSSLFEFCQGHGNAFGVSINENNIDSLYTYVKENLKEDIDINSYEVDFIIKAEDLTKQLIHKVASYRDEWGSVLSEPTFAITDINVHYNDISLQGKYKNTLKFSFNGIDFIKNFYKKDLFSETFSNGDNFYINVVGKLRINEWKGKQTPQVSIEDFEVEASLPF